VRLVVKDNFAICDVSVLGYVLEFNEEMCVGALNVADSARRITEASIPKGLEVWVFHEFHVFHFLARNWVYYGVGKMEICPMIGAQCNCLVGSLHVPEVFL
jgi:hypothetical protein